MIWREDAQLHNQYRLWQPGRVRHKGDSPNSSPAIQATRRRTRSHIANLVRLQISDSYASHVRPPPYHPQTRSGPHHECRRQNAECRMAGRSHPKPHQCDIEATSMRVASQAVATLKPPPCVYQATPMRPSCVYQATPMRPSCVHKAPTKRQQSHCGVNAE